MEVRTSSDRILGGDEAVGLVNDTSHWLSGTVATADPMCGWAIPRPIHAGTVRPNGGGGTLDPGAPSSGWRHSAIVSERGIEGPFNYTIAKSISLHVG